MSDQEPNDFTSGELKLVELEKSGTARTISRHYGWGKFALTAAMTVNGAAAIALMSGLPQFTETSAIDFATAKPWLIYALLFFGGGVALAVLCGAFAYFGDGAKIATSTQPRDVIAWMHGRTEKEPRIVMRWLAHHLHYATSTLWLLSWLAFCAGLWAVSVALA